VPLNRLLIQPTVQLSWLTQHRCIEFVLDAHLQGQFQSLWSLYRDDSPAQLPEFLSRPAVQAFNLVNHDRLFALLVGADYIQRQHESFSVDFGQANLVWSL
jgi:hypothetical protein